MDKAKTSNRGLKIALTAALFAEFVLPVILHKSPPNLIFPTGAYIALDSGSLYTLCMIALIVVTAVYTVFSVWKERVAAPIVSIVIELYFMANYIFSGQYSNRTVILSVLLELVVIALLIIFVLKFKKVGINKRVTTKEDCVLSCLILAQAGLSLLQVLIRSLREVDMLFGNYTSVKFYDLMIELHHGSVEALLFVPYLAIMVVCAVSVFVGKTDLLGIGAALYVCEILAVALSTFQDILSLNAAGFAFRWELIPHLLADAVVLAFLIRYLIKKRRERKAALQAELLPEQQA